MLIWIIFLFPSFEKMSMFVGNKIYNSTNCKFQIHDSTSKRCNIPAKIKTFQSSLGFFFFCNGEERVRCMSSWLTFMLSFGTRKINWFSVAWKETRLLKQQSFKIKLFQQFDNNRFFKFYFWLVLLFYGHEINEELTCLH